MSPWLHCPMAPLLQPASKGRILTTSGSARWQVLVAGPEPCLCSLPRVKRHPLQQYFSGHPHSNFVPHPTQLQTTFAPLRAPWRTMCDTTAMDSSASDACFLTSSHCTSSAGLGSSRASAMAAANLPNTPTSRRSASARHPGGIPEDEDTASASSGVSIPRRSASARHRGGIPEDRSFCIREDTASASSGVSIHGYRRSSHPVPSLHLLVCQSRRSSHPVPYVAASDLVCQSRRSLHPLPSFLVSFPHCSHVSFPHCRPSAALFHSPRLHELRSILKVNNCET